MLIEIFTDGKVVVDGQEVGKGRAESILRDYLLNPQALTARSKQEAKAA